jgi:hypothetical protein
MASKRKGGADRPLLPDEAITDRPKLRRKIRAWKQLKEEYGELSVKLKKAKAVVDQEFKDDETLGEKGFLVDGFIWYWNDKGGEVKHKQVGPEPESAPDVDPDDDDPDE